VEYVNYGHGSSENLSHREIARAFAFRQLTRNDEGEQALATGLKLTKKRLPWLTTIERLLEAPDLISWIAYTIVGRLRPSVQRN
jgi:hypothetical protein